MEMYLDQLVLSALDTWQRVSLMEGASHELRLSAATTVAWALFVRDQFLASQT